MRRPGPLLAAILPFASVFALGCGGSTSGAPDAAASDSDAQPSTGAPTGMDGANSDAGDVEARDAWSATSDASDDDTADDASATPISWDGRAPLDQRASAAAGSARRASCSVRRPILAFFAIQRRTPASTTPTVRSPAARSPGRAASMRRARSGAASWSPLGRESRWRSRSPFDRQEVDLVAHTAIGAVPLARNARPGSAGREALARIAGSLVVHESATGTVKAA
jgi:hypothetical protein